MGGEYTGKATVRLRRSYLLVGRYRYMEKVVSRSRKKEDTGVFRGGMIAYRWNLSQVLIHGQRGNTKGKRTGPFDVSGAVGNLSVISCTPTWGIWYYTWDEYQSRLAGTCLKC